MNCKNIFLILTMKFLILTGFGFAQIDFTKIIIDTSFAENSWPFDLNAVDLNGDNEIDLIVSSPDIYTGDSSVFLWYQNDGDENFSKNVIDTTIFGGGTFDVADLDGNLDNDIILAASSQISLYDNDGSGNFQKIIIDYIANPKVPIITNLDGDMDNDIVFSNHQGIFWENNDGSQNFTRDTVDTVIAADMGLYVSDLDDNSDNDVIVQIHIESESLDILVWYRNDGYENFIREDIDSSIQNTRQIIIDDLDDDSDQDIIAIDLRDTDDVIVWYQNDGNENFIKDTISIDFNQSPNSIAIADIDNDGDKDVIATGGNSAIGEVVYYENDGNENFTKHTIDNSPGNRQRIFVVDIEQDGDLDLFVTNNFPFEVIFYRNDGATTIGDELSLNVPDKFTLKQNYPNPFNPITTIEFSIQQSGFVKLSVYNILGEEVAVVVKEKLTEGKYKYDWDAGNHTSGVYFYRMETFDFVQTKKLLLIK